MSKTLEQLVEDLSVLSIIDMAKLKTLLEEKWGVKASAPMMVAPAVESAAAAVVESTEFQVTLEKALDEKKIGVIKIVREITGLGLKEAKEVVEGAPKVLKASCNKTEADEIAKKVTEAGGQVSVKGL